MKNLLLLGPLLLSVNAFSAVHGYWIEEAYCGKVAPFPSKVCILDVANAKEHFMIFMDYNEVEQTIGVESVANTDILIEKKGLKAFNFSSLPAMNEFNPKRLKTYLVSGKFVQFTDLQD